MRIGICLGLALANWRRAATVGDGGPPDPSGTITVTALDYARGDPGVAPTLTGTYSTTGTVTGPFTMFWTTRSTGTVLSKAAIENGTGDALDNGSSSAATLAGLVDIVMTLANSLTSGAIDVFIRDSSGTPVESDVASATGVTYDAVAPGFASAVIENATPSTMTLTLNKDAYVKVGETLEVADLTFGGTIAANVNGVTRTNATTYTFTLSTPAANGDTLTVALPTGTLVGIDAVDVAFTAQSVTNNVAAAGYTQSIVDNQGTGYLTVPAAMIPASNVGTLSFWVSSKGIAQTNTMFGNTRPIITFSGTNAIRIVLKREGTNTVQYDRLITGVISETAGSPTHVHIDWNLHATDPALSTVAVSINGVQSGTNTEGIDATNGFGNVWWSIGQGIGAKLDGSTLSNFAMADFYMESGVRRAVSLFYDGGPVDLTGVGAPQVLVNGNAAAWNAGTNNGSGGALTAGSATFVDV